MSTDDSNERRSNDGRSSDRGFDRGRSARGDGSPSRGERPPRRDGDSAGRPRRDGDRPFRRDGDRPVRRDGDRPVRRDGDRPVRRDGEARPYRNDGDRPFRRDGDRPVRRDGGERGFGGGDRRPSRDSRPGAGAPRRFDRDDARATRPPQDRRERGPELPDDITAFDLPGAARNELKTLSKDNADNVARHLAMAARLIDEDPALAHQHALAASRSAGRVGVVRETVAITAYAVGDFALALRELRTHRRITGSDEQLPLIVDSERGVGRADRALEEGRAVDRSTLSVPVRVQLAIAMSGARLDLGQTDRALQELEIPEADPDRAFEWSPALFSARAAVLEELGRDAEAAEWQRRADIAAEALDAAAGVADREVIVVEEIDLIDDDGGVDVASGVIPVDDVDDDDASEASDDTAGAEPDEHSAATDPGSATSDEEASASDEVVVPDDEGTASDDEAEGSR